MSLLKKIATLFCAAAISLCVFCSCTEKKAEVIKVGDKEYSANETVLRLDGYDIPLDFYRFCFLSAKANIESKDSDIDWSDEENRKLLSDEALGQIKYLCSVMSLADKYGYSLSKEDLSEVDSTMKNTFDSAGTAKDYELLLEENFLTHQIYQQVLEINALQALLADSLYGTDKTVNKEIFTVDDAIKNYNETNYRLLNIYFPVEYLDEDGNNLDDATYNKNKAEMQAKANSAYREIKNGALFKDVMDKYMGEGAYEADLQSYYPIETISNGLGKDLSGMKYNEVSDVIFAQECFFIIQRLENDTEYLKQNSQSIEASYAETLLDEALNELFDTAKIEKTELYEKITPETLS